MKTALICLAALLALSLGASAAVQPSPYAGQHQREIKALSAEDVEGYLSGSGMGFAKAAELNGLAGPRHVLDLAAALTLSPEQREKTQALFDRMKAAAIEAGRALVEKERELDRLFATRSVTAAALEDLLADIGALQSRVRAVHLRAHLAQVEILTPAQNARYSELRGYRDAADHSGHGSGGGHKH